MGNYLDRRAANGDRVTVVPIAILLAGGRNASRVVRTALSPMAWTCTARPAASSFVTSSGELRIQIELAAVLARLAVGRRNRGKEAPQSVSGMSISSSANTLTMPARRKFGSTSPSLPLLTSSLLLTSASPSCRCRCRDHQRNHKRRAPCARACRACRYDRAAATRPPRSAPLEDPSAK